MFNTKRVGRFEISLELFEQIVNETKIFTVVTPFEMHIDYWSKTIRCYGYSDLFEEVPESLRPPFYQFIVHEKVDEENGGVSYSFEAKQKNDYMMWY